MENAPMFLVAVLIGAVVGMAGIVLLKKTTAGRRKKQGIAD